MMLRNLSAFKTVVLSIVVCLLQANISNAQEIEITYNFDTVIRLLEIFDKDSITGKDFEGLIETKGAKAYIKKMSTFFKVANPESFRKSLKAAVSENPI